MQGVEPRLYRLDNVLGAAPWLNRKPVIVVESKACVERLWSTFGGSMPATSSVGGLGQWELGHTEQLKDNRVQDVAIIPDARKERWDRAYAVARSCAAAGLRVRMVFLPDGMENVCAYFEAGREKRALEDLILAAPSATGPVSGAHARSGRGTDALVVAGQDIPWRHHCPGQRVPTARNACLPSTSPRASRRAVRCPTACQDRRRQATLSC